MILFKPDMAQAILEGRKTVTRRRGKKRWNIGAEHLCFMKMPYGNPPGEPFAKVRIVSVLHESKPGDSVIHPNIAPMPQACALHEEGRREGFNDWREFKDAYMAINGEASLDDPCWRVEFSLMEALNARN